MASIDNCSLLQFADSWEAQASGIRHLLPQLVNEQQSADRLLGQAEGLESAAREIRLLVKYAEELAEELGNATP